QGGLDLLPVGLLHRIIRASSDNPLQRMALKQLSAGMQLLDQQLAAFERQSGWTVEEPAPPDAPAAAPPSPAPPPTRERPTARKAASAPPPPPDDEDGDGEMDDLRARLAALERRLSGD
ncbi:MAG: hypothetical protein KC621_13780, partial [Myxococcales bacterium]|nr:hypothetical protein [Myxococcales bacterium]